MLQKSAAMPELFAPPGARPIPFSRLVDLQKILCGQEVCLPFAQPVDVNTVVLSEKGARCTSFVLYAQDTQGKRIKIYQSDGIDRLQYCVFDTVHANALIFVPLGSFAGQAVRLQFIRAYFINRKPKPDFRVTVYYPLDKGSRYFSERVNDSDFTKSLDLITDLILIGDIRFLRDGTLYYDETVFSRELAALRRTIGSRPVRVWCCILNPQRSNGRLSNKDSVYAIRHRLDVLVKNIVAFCDKYQFCGIDFDWEFPYFPHIWQAHGKLLIELKKALGAHGKLLSAAFAPWNVWLSRCARQSLDFVNVMAYDWPKNRRHFHAEFYSCHVFSAAYFLKNGYTKKQLILGVPFYGNTCDRKKLAQKEYSAFDITSEWQNTSVFNGRPYYFNGCAMIRSKAAYTQDLGFGGVMVWCGAHDRPCKLGLSLFEALKKGIGSPN